MNQIIRLRGRRSEPVEAPPFAKIRTEYSPPPIPDRSCDWRAYWDNYEPGDPIGLGRTREAAIADLFAERNAYGDHGDGLDCARGIRAGLMLELFALVVIGLGIAITFNLHTILTNLGVQQ